MPTPTIAEVTVAAHNDVNVPNTPVMDVADIEPPDMVAVVVRRVVWLPYADVTLLAAKVV